MLQIIEQLGLCVMKILFISPELFLYSSSVYRRHFRAFLPFPVDTVSLTPRGMRLKTLSNVYMYMCISTYLSFIATS